MPKKENRYQSITPTSTGNTAYAQLIKRIAQEMTSGLVNAQNALEHARLKTYWEIGRHIREAVDSSNGALQPGDTLYKQMSSDILSQTQIALTVDTIRRIVKFYRNHPVFPDDSPLTFTHYLTLDRVTNKQQRAALEREAVKYELSVMELKQKIIGLASQQSTVAKQKTNRLNVKRGEPYIYITRPFDDLNGNKQLCIDCGFKIHIPFDGKLIPEKASFSGNKTRYVRSIKTSRGYDVRLAVRKREMMYTYAAGMLNIVDGDTLDALVDVGFGIRIRDRFRLKGINAPEKQTPAGKYAAQFLTAYLSKCPVIIIRTAKAGMYGRWLADIFAIQDCGDIYRIATEGVYVNQLLLDNGMAEKY